MSELVGRMSPLQKPVSNGFLSEKGIWKFPNHIYAFFSPTAGRQAGRQADTLIGTRPGSLASAILFFAEMFMLLTRMEGLPLNGVVSAGVIFAV